MAVGRQWQTGPPCARKAEGQLRQPPPCGQKGQGAPATTNMAQARLRNIRGNMRAFNFADHRNEFQTCVVRITGKYHGQVEISSFLVFRDCMSIKTHFTPDPLTVRFLLPSTPVAFWDG